ncbi:hypothetical protein [Devosia aquimaris]|uniref:hypothetical protein n=1 Tax=Devosia aquimaris TaxID=2866214 RepID=UPI001CD18A52|nr:hypothetical protein [Devosia sp. CJK-A8-3]
MLRAHTLTLLIERPAREVYRFLTTVEALIDWLQLTDVALRPEEDARLVQFDTAQGPVRIDLTAENRQVIDYSHWQGGRPVRMGYVRVIEHGEGCVLVHTGLQQPGVSAEEFVSEQNWVETDLLVLKSLLER